MRLLLDTNVVMDLLIQRAPWDRESLLIKGMAYFGDAEVWVPAKSFTDIFYVMRKSFGSAAVQQAILSLKGVFHLCSLEEYDVFEACSLGWDDLEDCLVALCAQKVKADYLITRDAKGFCKSVVPALGPEAFLHKMEADYDLFYDLMEGTDA